MTWSEYEKELNESRIPGLFTDFEWENYKYERYKKFVAGIIPDVATESVPAHAKSIPLSNLRKEFPKMKEGYVTERRAGKYVERRVRNMQSQGGKIRRLPFETLFVGPD